MTAFAGLVLSLVLPSTDQIQKYFHEGGLVAYLLLSPLFLWIAYRYFLPSVLDRVPERTALLLAGLTLLGLTAVFAVVYPIANSGVVGGGSDLDDSLNLAARDLLHGRYPYYSKTYLGNPVALLPGAIFLSMPFVVLGNSAYQNLFWVSSFFLLARRYLKSSRLALLLLWAALIVSPGILQQVVTGGDHPANSIYCLLFVLAVVNVVPRPDMRMWKKFACAGLLGLGLSSRANFLFLVPLIFSQLVQDAGWRTATLYVAVTVGVFGAVTLPFWLYDPERFTPLLVQARKVAQFNSFVPFSGILIPSLAGIASLGLALQRLESNHLVLLRNCALVLAIPVVFTSVLATIRSERLDLSWMAYGMFFLFFGSLAASMSLRQGLIVERLPEGDH
jgi:hypothetical protein